MKSMYLFLVLLSVITACTQASSLLDVDNLTESAFTDVVRDTPKDITVLNGYKKAKQMLNVEWTPLLNAIDSIPDRWGTGYYEPGVKRTGVPYSAVLETHTYIPQNIYDNLDKSVKDYEPKSALLAGEDGMLYYNRLFHQAKETFSNPTLLIEIDPSIKKEGHLKDALIIKDIYGLDRFALIRLL